ncbi:UDP-glucose 4-epimerase family protein [Rheinheimera sp. UJ63]|uniref:UDP-glucose 4-epimerase family protein n=1 Tax=Rheinheimera sp. UJ63 TaxID=2910157 RepID=UPI001F1E9825|nr:SDR family oxidoreductase [Rheinheimera sp. UJ63]MCF4009288.1 SDR family oxidoreductase [Rheinheimera sp. UJ63]
MNIVVTGHTGFVGQALVNAISEHSLRLVGRRKLPEQTEKFYEKSINPKTDFSDCLESADVVIHAAARVHVMEDAAADPLAAYRVVNVDGTLNLASQAAALGVKRFIFISSIKVNGEGTLPARPYTPFDQTNASDPYGVSKAEAEVGLKQIAADTGMEVVVIRPPLVYGPGVKANFAAMLKFAKKNLPLPLGAIHNCRSMVALDNLVDLIITCIDHPKAANQTFLVSDDRDISTTELLQMMTRAAGKKPWLIPLPMSWFKLVGKLTGKRAIVDRLCGNLQVDIRHTKDTLGWKPPVSVEEGISRCFAASK